MIHIEIDTSILQPQEILGLIALLNSLTSVNGLASQVPQVQVPQAQAPAPSPKNEEQAIFGVPVQPAPADASTPEPALTAEPKGEPSAESASTAKRHRRTKAEIAADEAQARAATALAAGVPVTEVPAAVPVAATALAQASVASTAKPLTAEELRALLNGYIARHSMEEAIGRLREFGCSRVTEALALAPGSLTALAEALNG
jgi:hypothetical protein